MISDKETVISVHMKMEQACKSHITCVNSKKH
jgi:hypothetical protein